MDQPPYEYNQRAIPTFCETDLEPSAPSGYDEETAVQQDPLRPETSSEGQSPPPTEMLPAVYYQGDHAIVKHSEYVHLHQLAKSAEEFRSALSSRDRELAVLHANISIMQRSHDATLKALEDHIAKLEANRIIFEKDNQSLRVYIKSIKTAQTQLRTDTHYADGLQGLNRQIQEWVANIFIGIPKKQKLTERAGAELLGILSEIVPYGNTTAVLLKQNITKAYEEPHKRVAVARHIFALYLWERVFTPFAFGLSREESTKYRRIEQNMIANGI